MQAGPKDRYPHRDDYRTFVSLYFTLLAWPEVITELGDDGQVYWTQLFVTQ
ncbi:MAG: hypothetical protein JWM80_5077 [Cyanobacteria bacterium RYN_339]|nr:hypothetical protein [Cyanobacteria bacterium RYN_339]